MSASEATRRRGQMESTLEPEREREPRIGDGALVSAQARQGPGVRGV